MLNRPITVHLSSGKVDGFSELQQLVELKTEMESELAKALAEDISNQVNITLHSTKEQYINALKVESNVLSLDTSNFVVHLVEEGNKPFDMKESLLNSPKAKIGKNGQKYIVVPISKYKSGRYNWRDRQTGQFSKGSNDGDVEFRIVSENSDSDAFVHPGHIGYNFVDRAIDNLDINPIIDKYLDLIL